mgnify:CR=1 FL=1
MKSEWFVASNPIDPAKGLMMYQAQRIKDTSAVDHSGNREYAGSWYKDKADAQAVADEMNEMEASNDAVGSLPRDCRRHPADVARSSHRHRRI